MSLSALALGTSVGSAHATYSIAAVDLDTRQVGGAVTSCIGGTDLSMVYASLPGVGVIHAQSLLDDDGRLRAHAIELMRQGMAPSDILSDLMRPIFDPQASWRQYGIVELTGEPVGYTGDDAYEFKGTLQGDIPGFRYSVQGNYLTGPEVLIDTTNGFKGGACDLAERLMLALEAGAQPGQGDARCTERGTPSDSAFIEVDLPQGPPGSYLKLSVVGTGSETR